MVEDIPVQYVEALAAARVDIIFQNGDVGELQRQQTVQKIVVVAAEVDDLCVVVDVEQAPDEVRVAPFPFFAVSAQQFPPVDDVTAQYECVARIVFEESVCLFRLGPFRAEMDVGHHNGFVVFGFDHRGWLFDVAKERYAFFCRMT